MGKTATRTVPDPTNPPEIEFINQKRHSKSAKREEEERFLLTFIRTVFCLPSWFYFHAKGGGGHIVSVLLLVTSCLFVICIVSELIGNSNGKQVVLPSNLSLR